MGNDLAPHFDNAELTLLARIINEYVREKRKQPYFKKKSSVLALQAKLKSWTPRVRRIETSSKPASINGTLKLLESIANALANEATS